MATISDIPGTPGVSSSPDAPAASGASGSLMALIENLHRQQETIYGRFKLLNYARKRARAQLGLLFHYESGRLLLVEQCGHAPRNLSIPTDTALSSDGLFASALRQPGLTNIDDGNANARCLPAERAWTWRNGRILLCPVGICSLESPAPGVLALCIGPKSSTKPITSLIEQEILLCTALLASYLRDDLSSIVGDAGAKQHVGIPLVGIRGWGGDDHTRIRGIDGDDHDAIDYPGILRQLAIFDESALAGGIRDEHEMHQRVVRDLSDALRAAGGALWLYSASQRQFSWQAGSGLDDSTRKLVQDELAHIAATSSREKSHAGFKRGPRVVTWSRERMVLLHLLECAGERVGAIALVLEGIDTLSPGQQALLESLGHAAAVMVRRQQQSSAMRQEAIDEERSRIARDMHDGAVQHIVHVLHTLDYAGRVAERQPSTARQEIARARESLAESLNTLRQSIASLLPAQLEQVSLDEALAALLDDVRRAHPAMRVRYEGAYSPTHAHLTYLKQFGHLPPSLEASIYRVVQEALNNASTHARANEVTLRVQVLPGILVVQVSDDGVGFHPEQTRVSASGSHFGLRTMRERVEQIGGTFTLTSEPGKGTTIKASFPLPTFASALTSRERDVLRLLVTGATNRIIAAQLSVSLETVKSHMHHIMQKLGAKDRTQAAVLAARQQWV